MCKCNITIFSTQFRRYLIIADSWIKYFLTLCHSRKRFEVAILNQYSIYISRQETFLDAKIQNLLGRAIFWWENSCLTTRFQETNCLDDIFLCYKKARYRHTLKIPRKIDCLFTIGAWKSSMHRHKIEGVFSCSTWKGALYARLRIYFWYYSLLETT